MRTAPHQVFVGMINLRALVVSLVLCMAFQAEPASAAQVGWFQGTVGSPALPVSNGPATVIGGPVAALPVPSLWTGLIAQEGEDFEIVKLRYADVSEIVGLLTGNQTVRSNDEFSPQEPNFGSSGVVGGGYFGSGGGLPTVPILSASNGVLVSSDSVGQAVDGTIGIDRRLNAIILKGDPLRVARIRHEIELLDVPVTSVVLETQFVELSETGARNLGLDFNNANGQIGGASVSYARGFPGLSDTPRLGGVTAAFQVALYAQIAKGEGRIVSKPRISAQSGATAKIVTGDALPILTSIALSGVNAVQQQVAYVNVGVTLQIAPRVSDDGFVTAHIFAVVSSVTGFSQGYPTISQREASTSATVRDGDTFIIGGLTEESRITNKSKLPLLGSLPLFGALFSVEHTSSTKRDLYIVVTPHIVTTGRAPV
ncbi:secretin N-terminal domain-containing protein [Sphingomonas sp. ASV193]|uniref:type II secretion system protein GspD n=1 Tax=Sphingomonas sp. ASV193 TaxID=3144405 RepID=UPI0032E911BC